jgi:hypothetical protein
MMRGEEWGPRHPVRATHSKVGQHHNNNAPPATTTSSFRYQYEKQEVLSREKFELKFKKMSRTKLRLFFPAKFKYKLTPSSLFSHFHTLIKKKIIFSSYIRKFRVEQLQSHIRGRAS